MGIKDLRDLPQAWMCEPCKRGRHDMCLKKNPNNGMQVCICDFTKHKRHQLESDLL